MSALLVLLFGALMWDEEVDVVGNSEETVCHSSSLPLEEVRETRCCDGRFDILDPMNFKNNVIQGITTNKKNQQQRMMMENDKNQQPVLLFRYRCRMTIRDVSRVPQKEKARI